MFYKREYWRYLWKIVEKRYQWTFLLIVKLFPGYHEFDEDRPDKLIKEAIAEMSYMEIETIENRAQHSHCNLSLLQTRLYDLLGGFPGGISISSLLHRYHALYNQSLRFGRYASRLVE